jgi:hypothetical protein
MSPDLDGAGRAVVNEPIADPTPVAELERRVRRRRVRRYSVVSVVALVVVVGVASAIAAMTGDDGRDDSVVVTPPPAPAGCRPVDPEGGYSNGWWVTDPSTGATATATEVWTGPTRREIRHEFGAPESAVVTPETTAELTAQAEECVDNPPVLPVEEWPARGVVVRSLEDPGVTFVVDEFGSVRGKAERSPLDEIDLPAEGGGGIWGVDPTSERLFRPSTLAWQTQWENLELPDLGGGPWSGVMQSPDLEWYLAQRIVPPDSCAPSAFFVRPDGSELQTLTGQRVGAPEEGVQLTNAVAWLGDNIAVAEFEVARSGCSVGAPGEPGLYAVQPGVAPRMLFHDRDQGGLLAATFLRLDLIRTTTTTPMTGETATTVTPHTDPPPTSPPTSPPTTVPPYDEIPAFTPVEMTREEAGALWEANGVAEYSFVWQRSCFCQPESVAPARLVVRDGRVVAAQAVDPARPILTELSEYSSVDELFELIAEYESNMSEGGTMEVRYHPHYGIPVSFDGDASPMIADEELVFGVTHIAFPR